MSYRDFRIMIRLGAIAFINTLPVYLDLKTDAEIVYDSPARLNAAMAEGRLDVSPVSSAYYLRNRESLVLLDDLSVSSPGSVESVLFLSRKPLEENLPDETASDQAVIAVPDDSETSITLLAHLIQRRTGRDPRRRFTVYPAGQYRDALEKAGSALIIGDNALMAIDSGMIQGYHCEDLASLWAEETGLPFVFAVWAANRVWAEQHPEALARLNGALCQSRDRFFQNSPLQADGVEQALARLARSRCTMSKERLLGYFTRSLTYGLDARHAEALNRFGQVVQELDRSRPDDRQQPSPPISTRVPAGAAGAGS